ncbi:hypothetical protein, partial [Shewanella sp.]|uniref:hypothetical protein n=1 Tax=Shewanella sp. TaxID=50422 RepID=UPI004047F5BC
MAPRRRTMPRKKPVKKPATYRPAFVNTIQIANLRPSAVTVKFQAKMKYLVTATDPTIASNSILQWNCGAGLKNPVIVSGNWVQQRAGDIFSADDYQQYFDRYDTYKVLGTKITGTIKPLPLDLGNQARNTVYAVRSVNSSVFSSTTPYYDIESSFGCNQRSFGQNTGTGYKECYIKQGYSPKKQFNLKDVKDNDELDVFTAA